MSSRRIFRAVHRINAEPVWSDLTDTPTLMREWLDATPLSLDATASHPHALSLQRMGSAPRKARRAFLQRWRDGLRWQSLVLAAAALLVLVGPARAQSPQAAFEQANQAYREQRYEAAAEGYRALVAQGVNDPAVWYDLGTTYAQLDDLGRARACLERARRLAPRDADVRANLAALQDRLTDKAPDDDSLTQLARAFTGNELAMATSVAWFLTAGLIVAWLKTRREGLAWLAALALGALLCCGGLFAVQRQHAAEGVVIPAEVKLYNGPGRDYTPSISLHAGARLQIVGDEGDWREVVAYGKVRGWVRAEQLEVI